MSGVPYWAYDFQNRTLMDKAIGGIMNRLVGQFGLLAAEFERLNVDVKPRLDVGIVQPIAHGAPGVVPFELRPVVFNVPEHPGSVKGNVFVVVEGMLSFERQPFLDEGVLRTHDFGTRVGYFRREAEVLAHVFGAHYDFALNQLSHPVFHAQIKSFHELAVHVRKHYFPNDDLPEDDRVKGMLKTVRLPVAQIDVFSLFLQVCADHFLHKHSGPEERQAFNSLLDHVTFCQGAAFQFPRLGSDAARHCYRARHWYPVVA